MSSNSAPDSPEIRPGTWIDVSIPLRSGMIHWPGDPEVLVERVCSLEQGDVCNVSRIQLGSHTGTHMDAPLHFLRDGLSIDEMSPDVTCGAARVIPIENQDSITVRELLPWQIQSGERILFRTGNSEQLSFGGAFSKAFVHVSADAAIHLAECRVRMVGVDYLSVGAFAGDGVATHLALLEAGIWIVEGLDLSRVDAGPVELLCLPLRVAGGDGAPARAFVRRL